MANKFNYILNRQQIYKETYFRQDEKNAERKRKEIVKQMHFK